MLVRVLYTRPDAKSRGVHVPTWCICSASRSCSTTRQMGFARTYVVHRYEVLKRNGHLRSEIRTYLRGASESLRGSLSLCYRYLIRTYLRAASFRFGPAACPKCVIRFARIRGLHHSGTGKYFGIKYLLDSHVFTGHIPETRQSFEGHLAFGFARIHGSHRQN